MTKSDKTDATTGAVDNTSEDLAVTVANLQTAHTENASAIETMGQRLEDVAADVESLMSKGAVMAQSGVFGAPAAEGGAVVGQIVTFLHHLFPGHAGLPPLPAPEAVEPVETVGH
jgi:hypothetical protein